MPHNNTKNQLQNLSNRKTPTIMEKKHNWKEWRVDILEYFIWYLLLFKSYGRFIIKICLHTFHYLSTKIDLHLSRLLISLMAPWHLFDARFLLTLIQLQELSSRWFLLKSHNRFSLMTRKAILHPEQYHQWLGYLYLIEHLHFQHPGYLRSLRKFNEYVSMVRFISNYKIYCTWSRHIWCEQIFPCHNPDFVGCFDISSLFIMFSFKKVQDVVRIL